MAWLVVLLIALMGVIPVNPCFGAVLSDYHHPISSRSALAQRHFDRGLLFIYGFDNAAAYDAFYAASQQDPKCAICYWGMALSLQSNPSGVSHQPSARETLQLAMTLMDNASLPERAYIRALAQGYSHQNFPSKHFIGKPAPLRQTYAQAMRQVAAANPTDPDTACLFALALMEANPEGYWQANGDFNTVGQELRVTLDAVLARYPYHPGALHLYLHLVETHHPEWALTSANRLRDLRLPVGHLRHMPAHIYLRLGRYLEAIHASRQAIAIDTALAQTSPRPSIATLAHRLHNYYFLWYLAMRTGREQIAVQAAEQIGLLLDPQLLRQPGYGMFQHYFSLPLYTLIRFGKWPEILDQPPPAPDLLYPTGVWHLARGMAAVARGEWEEATQELAELQSITNNPDLAKVTLWQKNKTANLLEIGVQMLAGKLAAGLGQPEQASRRLAAAMLAEQQQC